MSEKQFDGVELSDEALEGVSGGLIDLFDSSEPITITVADMVATYKEQGMTKEAARADLLNVFAQFNAVGVGFSQEDIDKNMAEFDAIW